MRTFGASIFRVLGVYVIAIAVTHLMGLLPAAGARHISTFAWILLSPLLVAAVGVGIFSNAEDYAARWWPAAPAPSVMITPDDFFRLAMAFLGVMFFARSVPILVNAVASILMFDTTPDSLPPHVYPGLWKTLVSALIQVLVALYLFFWSDGLLFLWKRARGRQD